jgi:hypothetical protein
VAQAYSHKGEYGAGEAGELMHEWTVALCHAWCIVVPMAQSMSTHTALRLAALLAQRGMSKQIGSLQLSARLIGNGVTVNAQLRNKKKQ